MTDHTNHNHPATPAGRRTCRASVATAQRMYLAADAGDVSWDDYLAKVEWMATDWALTMREMRNVIENGPCR
jgi:hypothetical protein